MRLAENAHPSEIKKAFIFTSATGLQLKLRQLDYETAPAYSYHIGFQFISITTCQHTQGIISPNH